MAEKKRHYSFQVTEGESRLRLDTLLNKKFQRITRTVWQERIRSGLVFVNKKHRKPSFRVKSNDTIEFTFLQKEEPPVNRNYSIVHEDESIIIIEKPSNIPVHPAGIYYENTLCNLLKNERGGNFITHFIHRLDRETSGLLLMGKSRTAASYLNQAFRKNLVRKEYLTLVEGTFPERHSAKGYLSADDKSSVHKKRKFVPASVELSCCTARTEHKSDDDRDSQSRSVLLKKINSSSADDTDEMQSCHTDFRKIKTIDDITLLHVRLHTGRLHQIRATLCSLGYPVVGDRLYGIDESLYLKFISDEETPDDRKRLRMDRTALHCRRLVFPHPESERRITFVSPIPDDMRKFIQRQSTE